MDNPTHKTNRKFRGERGQIFLHWEGGTNIFTLRGGDKHFYTERGEQTFYVKDVGGDGDVDGEEEDVSEASKLSAGDRIFRGP